MSRTIPPQLRRQVWETHMAEPRSTYGPCFVCGGELHYSQFECGHVISHANGGDLTVDNLRPICGSCNKSMGTRNLFEYKQEFFSGPPSSRTRAKTKTNQGKPKDTKEIKESPGLFHLGWPLLNLFRGTDPNPEPSPNPGPRTNPGTNPSNPSNPSKSRPKPKPKAKSKPDMDHLMEGFVKLSLDDSSPDQGCRHILLSGKRKGSRCGKPSKDSTGRFCNDHNPEHPCQHILVSGKRKGQRCGKPSRPNSPNYCARHNPEL